MRRLLIAFLLPLCGPLSAAGPAAPADIESLTREQIGKLDTYFVTAYAFKDAKKLNAEAFTTAAIKKQMAILLYPVDMSNFSGPERDPKFKDQIKGLQKSMDVPETGVLLQEQFDVLNNAAEVLAGQMVYPPPGLSVTEGPGVISAKGTWVMEDDAFPVNYSEITCLQSTRNCTDININVVLPRQYTIDSDFQVILGTTDYAIVTWDRGEVTAVHETKCRRDRLTINTGSKQAALIETDKDSSGCTLPDGSRMSLLGKPRVATLGDGFKEPKKIYDRRREQAQRLLYKPAQKAIGTP